MRLNDRDNSVLALKYVFATYAQYKTSDEGHSYQFIEVVSHANKSRQCFYYEDKKTLEKDLDFIDRWIMHMEMGLAAPKLR